MDRCHRIGQTRPVHVYRLATSHSVEVRFLCIWLSLLIILSNLLRRNLILIILFSCRERLLRKHLAS